MAIIIIKTENIFKRARAFLWVWSLPEVRKEDCWSQCDSWSRCWGREARQEQRRSQISELRRGEERVECLHYISEGGGLLYRICINISVCLHSIFLLGTLYSHFHFYGAFIEVFNWKPNETSISLKPSIQSGQITSNDSNDSNAMIAMFPFRQTVKRSRTK